MGLADSRKNRKPETTADNERNHHVMPKIMNRISGYFKELDAQLQGKDRKKIDGNTYLERDEARIVIRFHTTFVVMVLPDNTIVLNSGGWETPTTKTRMNKVLNRFQWTIIQDKSLWWLVDLKKDLRYRYSDGTRILPNRMVLGYAKGPEAVDSPKLLPLITRYVQGYVFAWRNGQVPPPDNGDPYLFYRIVRGKRVPTPTELPEIRAFMIQAMRINYCFGSLLMAALNRAGGADSRSLSLLDKHHVAEWLAKSKPVTARLMDATAPHIEKVLIKYIKSLFGVTS